MALSMVPQQFSTKIRVLMIDHDINLLDAFEKLCYQFHYSVKTCSKASDALNLLMENKNNFDLILIEAKMPDIDSYEFLQHVTQQINIPVIMICADNTRSAVMKAIDCGACDFWMKPLTENLIQNMWQHVARKIWKQNKNLELSDELEVEVGMKKEERHDSNLPLIDPKIGVVDTSEKQESVEKNNDNPELSDDPKIGVVDTSEKQESVEKNNDKPESSAKKTRITWSPELHKKFVSAVKDLNVDKAVPKKILAKMNEPELTKQHVASHLQKYRLYLKSGGETKKQKTQREATKEFKSSPNGSSEFDFQAYDASTSHVVPNTFIPTNFPHQSNTFIPTNFSHQPNTFIPPTMVNAAAANFYQTDFEEETSSTSVNQQNHIGFETNSMINPLFINTLNPHFPNSHVQNMFLAPDIISHQIPMNQPFPMIFDNSISSYGLSPHQIPMTQPLPMNFGNSISSYGLSPFCGATYISDTISNTTRVEEEPQSTIYASTKDHPFF